MLRNLKRITAVLLCFCIVAVDVPSNFAASVNAKTDAQDGEEFQLHIYQAENYLEKCGVSEDSFDTISPSQIMYDAGVESGLAVSAAQWESFTTLLDSFDKPSSMVGKAFEKKDLYAGLILSVFECEYSSDSIANMDVSQIKNVNSLYKQFDSFCKANDYIYSTSNEILFSDMSQAQKERLLKLTNTFADADKEGDVWMSVMGDVDKALEVMDVLDDVEEWCTYIVNCIQLNELNENTKQVLEKMYQESSDTGNLDMSLAFKESLDIAQESGIGLASEITGHLALQFTKKATEEVIDTFWGEVKKSAQAANPYIASLWIAYGSAKLFVKLVFNSDDITEKYCKMDALLQIREVAGAVYKKAKEAYQRTKSESDAAVFIASRDLMYQCIDVDCECASEYVDSVESGLWAQIKLLFQGCSNISEAKEDIQSIQDNINTLRRTIQLNWVYWLQEDYPEEYEHYKSLLVDFLPSVKLSQTSISMAVGEKVELGYELSDPCYFLGGKIKESWTTTDADVALVNSMGTVSALKQGTAEIKLRFLDSYGDEVDGIYQDCTVTVIGSEIQLTLNKSSITMNQGETYTLKAALKGSDDKITWSSSKTSVAIVSQNGKITAKKEGTALITAKAGGVKATCRVAVENAVDTGSGYEIIRADEGMPEAERKLGSIVFSYSSSGYGLNRYGTLYVEKSGRKTKIVSAPRRVQHLVGGNPTWKGVSRTTNSKPCARHGDVSGKA